VVQRKFNIFLIHSTLSQTDPNRNPWILPQFGLNRYDTRTNEHIWSRNSHYWIIHSPYHYPYIHKKSLLFEDL